MGECTICPSFFSLKHFFVQYRIFFAMTHYFELNFAQVPKFFGTNMHSAVVGCAIRGDVSEANHCDGFILLNFPINLTFACRIAIKATFSWSTNVDDS